MSSISVIITSYNSQEFIEDALKSVEEQTFSDIEVLIVDDASKDKTVELIQNFIVNSSMDIQLIKNKRNRGVSFSRNTGLKNCKSDCIAFLDADDYWQKDKLQKQWEFINAAVNQNVGVVYSKVNVVADEKTQNQLGKGGYVFKDHLSWQDEFDYDYESEINAAALLHAGNHICLSSTLIRKKAIEYVGGFDELLPFQIEDYLMWCLISFQHKIKCIPEKLTNYRIHLDGYTVSNLANKEKPVSSQLIRNLINDRIDSFCNSKNINRQSFRLELATMEPETNRLQKLIKKFENLTTLNSPIKDQKETSRDLEEIIIHVTDTCNLRCSYCFIDKFANNHLSLEDFKKILSNLGEIKYLMLTGGEPFFNKQIVPILLYALQRYPVYMNSNAYETTSIIKSIKELLSYQFNYNLCLSISIDGLEPLHDELRCKVGSYQRAIDSMRMIEEIRRTDQRISVNINTTLTSKNISQINKLIIHFGEKFDLNFHNIEIVRDSPEDDAYFVENKKYVEQTYKEILENIKKYYPGAYLDAQHKYRKQLDLVLYSKKWGYDCLAAENNLVVFANGETAACEKRSKLLNVKEEYDFDVTKALNDERFLSESKSIKDEECCCSHGCWLQTSYSPVLRKEYSYTDEYNALRYKKIWDFLNKNKFLLLPAVVSMRVYDKIKRNLVKQIFKSD